MTNMLCAVCAVDEMYRQDKLKGKTRIVIEKDTDDGTWHTVILHPAITVYQGHAVCARHFSKALAQNVYAEVVVQV